MFFPWAIGAYVASVMMSTPAIASIGMSLMIAGQVLPKPGKRLGLDLCGRPWEDDPPAAPPASGRP